MDTELDDIKKLRPDERIKKLKELERKRKEEIEKAEDMIRSSEHELRVEEELRDIPIPQVKAVDIDQLFGADERQMFKTKRFLSEGMIDIAPESQREKKTKEEESLEETVSKEATQGSEAGPVYGLASERVKQNLSELYDLTQKKVFEEMVGMRNRAAGGAWDEEEEQRLQYRMNQMERAEQSQQYVGESARRMFEEEKTLVDQIDRYRRRMGV